MRRQKTPGELTEDESISAESETSHVIKSVFEHLQQERSTRFTRLSDINFQFGYLLDVENFLNKESNDKGLERFIAKVRVKFIIQVLMELSSIA